jgi:hypothetical protein
MKEIRLAELLIQLTIPGSQTRFVFCNWEVREKSPREDAARPYIYVASMYLYGEEKILLL